MRTVVITGASKGIGRALAEKFLAQGDVVIGTSRSGTAEYQHENLRMFPLELGNAGSISDCADLIAGMDKKIDVFINNAGIWDERDEGPEVGREALDATLSINLLGPIDFCERLMPMMNDGSHIINVSSRRGSMEWTSDTLYPAYSISKAGLNMYTRKLAMRVKGKATVSCVHPGSVRTEMNPEGEMTVEQSAQYILELTERQIETGQFWYKGERFPW